MAKSSSELKLTASEEQPINIEKCILGINCSAESIIACAPGLCDLPTEMLEAILGHMDICDYKNIRATSKRLRDVSDGCVMREFRKALKRHTNHNPTSRETAALKVIQYATEGYVRSGFGSTFCGCIIPILSSYYTDPFHARTSQIEKFLVQFYNIVDEVMNCSQQSHVLYNLTLMRFFTKFDRSIISSTAIPLHWCAAIELKGPWLGMYWTEKTCSCYQRAKCSNMLVVLSEMLIANITGVAFIRAWKCRNEIYLFGENMRDAIFPSKTYFIITVNGSKRICSLFSSCLEDPSDQFKWPSEWPKDKFTVNLDIICPDAMKWGFSKTQHLEFSQESEPRESSDVD